MLLFVICILNYDVVKLNIYMYYTHNNKGLQSYEDMMKEHALVRMQEGLLKILQLHTPVELSSLCGCLGI